MRLESYAAGQWVTGTGKARRLSTPSPANPSPSIEHGLDFAAMLDYGRTAGGPALRKLTFHERARLLKAMAPT